jgi:toluene monooxygenase system ferredoxin subunit
MDDSAELTERLRRSDFLRDVSPGSLAGIARIAERESFDEGDPIYQLGDPATDLFIVESGRIRFTLGVGNRGGTSGSVISEGQVVGWAAVLEDQPRRLATALCLEDSKVIRINGAKLLAIFDGDTASGYAVMRRLATMIAHDLTEVLTA